MSQAGIVEVVFGPLPPDVPTLFVENVGTAIPIANTIEVLAQAVAAHSVPAQTVGSGNTIEIDVQYTSAAASSIANNAGLASFSSSTFSVDANGYVTLNGSVVGQTITGNLGGPLSPTGGNWNIFGSSTAAGTTPVQTSGTGSTLTVQVQKSQAIASTNAANVGLAAFNSSFFTVDGNGFVSLNGSSVGETITGTVGGALSPTAGNWNIFGSSTAAGSTPVQTSGTGSTLTVQVQKSQAIASTNAANVGLAAFDSASFGVDGNGFVTFTGGTGSITIAGDVGTPATGTSFTFNANSNAGKTAVFSVTGSTIDLLTSDTSTNTWIGKLAGSSGTGLGNTGFGYSTLSGNSGNANCGVGLSTLSGGVTGNNNTGFGTAVLISLTGAAGGNTSVGQASMNLATNTLDCIAIGRASLQRLLTGSDVIAIGSQSAFNYTSSESSNIVIGNLGTTGESNVIRIGTQGSGTGQQDLCYVAGITGATPTSANTPQVVLCDNTGNLAPISSSTAGFVLTSNGTATPSFQAISSSGGKLLQQTVGVFNTYAALNGIIPYDNTPPQNNEGNLLISVNFTPVSASSQIYLLATLQGASNRFDNYTMTICDNAIANCLTAGSVITNSSTLSPSSCATVTPSTGTTLRTFTLRAGPGTSSGLLYINGDQISARYGGTCICTLSIWEIAP